MDSSQSFFACSSIEWLNTSYRIVYLMGAISVVIVVICIVLESKREKFSWFWIYLPLLILQPVWSVEWKELSRGFRELSADCGFGSRFVSLFLAICLLLTSLCLLSDKYKKRSLLMLLAGIAWLIYVAAYFLLFLSPSVHDLLSTWFSHAFADQIVGTLSGMWSVRSYAIVLTLAWGMLYPFDTLKKARRDKSQNDEENE